MSKGDKQHQKSKKKKKKKKTPKGLEKQLTVIQLRALCIQNKLAKAGKKKDLLKRLAEAGIALKNTIYTIGDRVEVKYNGGEGKHISNLSLIIVLMSAMTM